VFDGALVSVFGIAEQVAAWPFPADDTSIASA